MDLKHLMSAIRTSGPSWQMTTVSLLLVGAFLYLLEFTYAYLDNTKQIYFGWGCFAVIFLMYKFKKSRQPPLRLILLILAAFLALRYLQWRTFDTLLYTGPMDFIGMSILYLAEVYGLVIYLLGMFVNVWPMESPHIPLPADADKLPTVDIFIPTYNESDDIVRITATAATQIDYPREKLRIYIIDDGGSQAKRSHPESGISAWARHYRMRQMAAELGIGYITRETNQHAKAGNINHALQYTDGDLLLVLDCDHVPTKDFLQNTVGHFIADPKLFLVQTPHFFINPTPVEKSLGGTANPSGENDMFYRRIHPALNFWNASFFCGSAALLRRKYLMEAGGIRGTTITEDAETAFHLHSLGYNSVYINRPMVCGLSPESYDDYVIQRSRWAQGMVQMLMLNNPLKTKGLSIPQKIAYFNSSFFWLFGFPRFIYFIAPASYLILGLNIYHASSMQILSFTLPYVLSIYVMMDFFYAGTRQPFFSEIYESVQSLFLIPAVISVFLNPWKPSFKVTPKGSTNDKDYLSPMAAPFFLVIAINLLALVLASFKWFAEPLLRDVIIVTGVWSVYNLYLALLTLGAFWERKQVRKFYRIGASGSVSAFFPRIGATCSGTVCDVSVTGIGFEMQLPFPPEDKEQVVLHVKDRYGREYRFENSIQRTANRNGKYFCGSEFVTDRNVYAEVVSYVFGDSQRWQDNWDQKSASKGTVQMLWHFMKAGSAGFMGSLIPLARHALIQTWTQLVKWTTTPVLRDTSLAISSWCVYHLYSALISLVGMLDQQKIRKLQRINTSGSASIYFPRLHATLLGELADISLNGIGVMVELPFELKKRERVMIKIRDRDGKDSQFECYILRTVRQGTKSLCGASFIMDVFSYPRIVKFVYGDSLQMLHYLLMPESGLAAQGKNAAIKIMALISDRLVRALKIFARVLAFLFLNPKYRAAISKERKS
ncbi:MAG: UDP-forming cellulose synthase catalytic subunit [Nitrosomonadales bacterium]|nr:UDP-forming cellulose synthase catalytic subunit [Nitrosomonadales bacterium]